MTTTAKLTAQELQQWQAWCIEKLQPRLTPFSDVQQPGTFLVISSRYKPTFLEIGSCWLNTFTIDKVTKLKIGKNYRSNVEGWIVPDDLVSEFRQCREVSIAYRNLRRNAIDLASKLPRNGYERIATLNPEKMQALIDIFEA